MYTQGRQQLLHRRRPRRAVGRPAGEPAQHPRQAVHRLLLRLPPQPSPGVRGLDLRGLPLPGRRAADEGPLRRTATSTTRSSSRPHLGEFYYKGFGQTEEASELAEAHPDKLTYNHYFDPRNGEAGPGPAARGRREVQPQGRQALHRRVARRVPRLEARRPVGLPVLRGVPRARHHEHPRPQGPDDPAAGPRRLRRRRRRPRGHDFTDLNFVVEHCGLPRLEDFCWIATQEPNVLRRPGRRDAVHPHPAAVLRADHRRAPVLDRRGPHPVLLATTRSGRRRG